MIYRPQTLILDIQDKILVLNQYGAIKNWQASDFTTALLCDKRQVCDKKNVAAKVTTDVKSAIDGVFENQLIHRRRL